MTAHTDTTANTTTDTAHLRCVLDGAFGGATAPFLLQAGADTTEDLTVRGSVSLVAAPGSAAAPGCEPEFAVGFGQRDGGVYLFQ